MADVKNDKFFMVAQQDNYGAYDTYEEAEQVARRRAWNGGEEYFVMTPVAKICAPEEINTTKVVKL
jgi:hypothetical protein